MVVCINLYNLEFIQTFIYSSYAADLFSLNRELNSNQDASSITTFSLVDKEIKLSGFSNWLLLIIIINVVAKFAYHFTK